MSKTLVLSVIASLLALPAAAGNGGGRACDEPYTVLFASTLSGVDEEGFRTIEDAASWCAFWDEAHSFIFPPPACDPSAVDFDTHVVLVASLGPRPDLCHSVSIPCVQALGASGGVRVFVESVAPGPDCACPTAIAHPVVAIALERPKFTHVRDETVTLDCN